MATTTADEAQALLYPGVRVETGRIRDGVVDHAEVVEIPEEYFDRIQRTVAEHLTFARNSVLSSYPRTAANSVVERLVHDGVLHQSDASKARDLVELEIKRGIEHLYADARDRYAARLPIFLRSLVPLITRRSGTK